MHDQPHVSQLLCCYFHNSWIGSRNLLHLDLCVIFSGQILLKILELRNLLKRTIATTLSGDAPTITGSTIYSTWSVYHTRKSEKIVKHVQRYIECTCV